MYYLDRVRRKKVRENGHQVLYVLHDDDLKTLAQVTQDCILVFVKICTFTFGREGKKKRREDLKALTGKKGGEKL